MAGELMSMSAVEQAAAVRTGDVSAVELVEASLATIDRRDGEINAVVTRVDERALAEAERVPAGDERPLAGVPVLIKDLTQLTEGVRTTYGSAATGDFVPQFDTSVVRKLREAGAILVGKTSTPELGILPTTEPHRFGPTRNPWDTTRTSGGSSGGASAAVAAGMVALGHGSDGGGSIRIPASCCGLVGLKPTRGRVSWAPDWTEGAIGLPTDGVLTRTVLDTAVALDLIHGYEPGDSFLVPPPSAPFAEAVTRGPGKLRCGFTRESPNGAPVDPECQQAVIDAAALLEELGHEVVEASLPRDEGYVENFVKVWVGGTEDELHTFERWLGAPLDRSKLEPLTAQMAEISAALSATELLGAIDYLRRLSRTALALWTDLDVLITPTLAKPPIEIGALRPAEGEPPIQMLLNSAGWVPFTPVFNVTGQPAISLPLHQSADGLPIGVQFVGAPATEEMLLSLAAQLEQARPWADRRPPVHTAA
ncbi:MAG: amidase [Thermoleophilaceae bacterium]|nr:amidase [Thermoleophilaceae bacterium]